MPERRRKITPPAARMTSSLTRTAASSSRLSRPRDRARHHRLLDVDALLGGNLRPAPVVVEFPRQHVVREGDLDDLVQPLTERRIVDGHGYLDPAVQVARHQVCGADVVAGSSLRIAEPVDPGVLEEPTHDRADADRLRQPGDLRPEAADAAHREVDPGAGRRRLIKRFDRLWIDERIELQSDPTLF